MKEVNKPEEPKKEEIKKEEPKKEEPKKEEPKKEEPKKEEPKKKEVVSIKEDESSDRPYIGYKKDKLEELIEEWRKMYNNETSKKDRDYAKSKVIELEQEIKRR